jgi:hypothetical protein
MSGPAPTPFRIGMVRDSCHCPTERDDLGALVLLIGEPLEEALEMRCETCGYRKQEVHLIKAVMLGNSFSHASFPMPVEHLSVFKNLFEIDRASRGARQR